MKLSLLSHTSLRLVWKLQSGTVTLLTPLSNAVHAFMAQGVCPTSKRLLHLAQWGSVV